MKAGDLVDLLSALSESTRVMEAARARCESALALVPQGPWVPAELLADVRRLTLEAVDERLRKNASLLAQFDASKPVEALEQLNLLKMVASERMLESGLDIGARDLQDVTLWAHQPDAVRELLRHAPRPDAGGSCPVCEATGGEHRPTCSLHQAWRLLGHRDARGVARTVSVHSINTNGAEDVFELSELARRRLIEGGVAPLRISTEVRHAEVSTRILSVDGRPVWEAVLQPRFPDLGIEERWLVESAP